MNRRLLALIAGMGCLASACSGEDAGWIGDLDGVMAGRVDEDISSPMVVSRRQGLDGGGELGLARAFFPELAPKPESSRPDPMQPLRVTVNANELEIAARGRIFRVRSLSGEDHRIWAPVDGEGTNGQWVTSRIEEYVVTEAGAAPYRERFEVTVPDEVVLLRDAGDYLEFVDTENVPILRMHQALARDEWGHWRQGRARMWGVLPVGLRAGLPALALRGQSLVVELSVGFEGLAGKVVVDPGWSSTAAMSVPRNFFTQTLLPSGKLLVAGGCSDACNDSPPASAYSSAEIYDPATNTWQATGSMTFRREMHAATLLLDGRVLVVGGSSPNSTQAADPELYDPTSGMWQQTTPMIQFPSYMVATLLPSGKALVVGAVNNAELYDPARQTWDFTGPMAGVMWGPTVTALASGRILAAGGSDGSGYCSSSAQLYDPASNTWLGTGSMTAARCLHTATLLPSGKVLVVGGRDPNFQDLTSAELFDPATGTWSPTGSSALRWAGTTATLLPSGKVLRTIGATDSEIYDPAAGTWRAAGLMLSGHGQAATLLASGKTLVCGVTLTCDAYDPGAGTWSGTAAPSTARSGASLTQLPDGKILIAGGRGASGPTATAELYDPATRAWLSTGSMNGARSQHTATLLSTGAVLVAGGNGPGGPLNDAELYDPVSSTWSATGSMAGARSGHTATLLPSGALLVAGGSGAGALASAELYHPTTGAWTLARPMSASRAGHTATLLPGGHVLIAGGQSASGVLASTELYDPSVDAWSAGRTLIAARMGHTATLLPSGRVLIAGGQGATGPLASVEVSTLATGAWWAGGTMAAARSGHRATLLASGKVLVATGMGAAGRLAGAEVYDEATDTWRSAGALATPRAEAAAILLVNGKVLIAGGSTAAGNAGTAELYDDAGASDAWRPSLAAISPLRTGEPATAGGSGFRGISEASNGSEYGNSPSNVPVAQLLPLAGGALPVPLQAFTNTSLSLTVPPVPDGFYLLAVSVNAIPGGAVVFVDGPPAAPALSAPAPVVGSAQPLIAGSAESGSTVTVALDGNAPADVSADGVGAWSLVPASSLAEGPHVVKARATDALGRSGAWSSPLSFAVDTTPPAAPTFTSPGAWAGAQPTLSGTSEPGSQVMVWVDGAVAGSTAASGGGRWSLAVTSPLADGPHTATAQAQDAAGNTGAVSSARSFIVDSIPPPQPAIDSPADEALLTIVSPSISGTAESGSIVTVTVDGYVAGTPPADASGAWACTPSWFLPQGAHSATAQARDAAGNVSQVSAPRLFMVDSIAPAPPVVLTPSEGAIESSQTPLISGTAEIGSSVTIWIDGVAAGTVGTTDIGAWSFFPTSLLPAGAHTVKAEATDAAGNNTSSVGIRSFTVQLPRPEVPQILLPSGAVGTSFPRISGKATSGDSVDVVLDGALAGTVWPDAEGAWSFTPSTPLADGLHTATAQAYDPELHPSLMSNPITFTVDTVVPATPTLETPGSDALVRTATPPFAGMAEPGSTVAVELDGQVAGTPEAGKSGAWTFTPPPLGEGRHVVVLQATDAAGNASPPSRSRSFTVRLSKSFYGSGCSAAPAGDTGVWLLLVLLGAWRPGRNKILVNRCETAVRLGLEQMGCRRDQNR